MKILRSVLTLAWAACSSPLFGQVPPEKAESTFTVHQPDLEWKLWASEPLFANPTCMDIDHLGRVWVCESVNYRHTLRKQPPNRPAGDRILILEDSRQSGKADRATVFYQSPELLAPLGIAVAKDPTGRGWKVYVCQSPDILVFEDKDGNGTADGPPKKLLTGFQGYDHDHGVHGILIGPDGKLYFSVGDRGVKDLQNSDGKGRKWTTNHTDCQAGTIWRCDMDGTNLELIAHNFRNQYEPCVDSFGNIWTSDNDDDGNQQTRICYVMPGGNYGYWPRGKGESHWHEEQPGVVPKVLRTHFGSPTGMCVYEGTLLPKKYQGQLLHTDAGPRQLRCYHTKPKGAGYEIEREDIVTSTDNWFRPSDVCVAPDGSVFVADWYDPGVGGHGMGDTTRGRIYRLAPKGHKHQTARLDLASKDGVLGAMGSPNLATRHVAIALLKASRVLEVFDHLEPLSDDPRRSWVQARALTQLAVLFHRIPRMGDMGLGVIGPLGNTFAATTDEQTRALILRLNCDYVGLSDEIASFVTGKGFEQSSPPLNGASAFVLGTTLSLLRNCKPDRAKPAVVELARRYNGQDRFYLAALGIAVGADPKRREVILADFDKHFPEWNDKVADLVWELRPPSVLPRLERLLADGKLPTRQRARIVDILATGPDAASGKLLMQTLVSESSPEIRDRILTNLKLFLPTKWKDLARSPDLAATIDRLLAQTETAPLGLALIAAAERVEALPQIRTLLNGQPSSAVAREAVQTLGALPSKDAVALLQDVLRRSGTESLGPTIMEALGRQIDGRKNNPGHPPAMTILQNTVMSPGNPATLREAALSALAGSRSGTQWLLEQHRSQALPADLIPFAGRFARNTPYPDLRNMALIAFPAPAKLDLAKLPPLSTLATRRGDAGRGQRVLAASLKGDAQCLKCHSVKGEGGNVGPDLSTIGTKASRENLFESILYPNKAIADQYVHWTVTTTRGVSLSGMIVEETADHIVLRDANGKDTRISRRDVVDKDKNPNSMMPGDSALALSEDELVDVVEYLVTLQTAVK